MVGWLFVFSVVQWCDALPGDCFGAGSESRTCFGWLQPGCAVWLHLIFKALLLRTLLHCCSTALHVVQEYMTELADVCA